MTWIELGNPTPRPVAKEYHLVNWGIGEALQLSTPALPPLCAPSFYDVLQRRRTSRTFSNISLDELSTFLAYIAGTQAIASSEMGFDLELRPTPSAGAIHPIHILVKMPASTEWWVYESKANQLLEINRGDEILEGLQKEVMTIIPAENAHQLLLVAEPGKSFAKYDQACSLIWRDTGVMLGIMALTAEALGLSFCPLGITGEPWAHRLSQETQLAGVGVALLGAPSADTGVG
jgi:SagB-type dehydrogenase family enzyme